MNNLSKIFLPPAFQNLKVRVAIVAAIAQRRTSTMLLLPTVRNPTQSLVKIGQVVQKIILGGGGTETMVISHAYSIPIPEQFTQGMWWTKWHWDTFLSECLRFPLLTSFY
jgi:glutathionylspermidine synthase